MGGTYRDTERKREALKRTYPSAQWAKKVNLMPPDQVDAVYIRLRNQNKLK